MNLKKISIGSVFQFSFPIMVSQSCDSLMLFTGRYLLAKVSPLYATASLAGGMMAMLLWIFGVGLLGFITPLVAQYHGAREDKKVLKVVTQGVWLSLALSIPLLLWGTSLSSFYLKLLKIPTVEYQLATRYVSLVVYSCVFVFLKSVFGNFFSGLGYAKTVMAVNLCGVVINIPIMFIFINYGFFGHYTGFEGYALGTIVSEVCMTLFFMLVFFYTLKVRLFLKKSSVHPCGSYLKASITRIKNSFDKEILRKIIVYGTPMGFDFFALTFVFNTFLMVFHSFGLQAAEAISIAVNWSWLFVLPFFGLNIAIMSLVGKAMGENNPQKAAQIARCAAAIGGGLVGVASIAFWCFPDFLIAAFNPNFVNEQLLQSMVKTLPIYCLLDGICFITTAVLRAAGDSKYCFYVGAVCNGAFLILCCAGTYYLQVSPFFIWWLFMVTMAAQALGYLHRYFLGHWKRLRVIEG